MIWKICFAISIGVICLTALAVSAYRKKRGGNKTSYIVIIGVALAAITVLYPVCFGETEEGGLRALLLAVHNTFRLFVLDDDFSLMIAATEELAQPFRLAYWMLAAALYLAAPIMTFSVVLSFFRNYVARRAYRFHFFSPVYAFSELNEKSLALAKDLKKENPHCLIVFAGVGEETREKRSDDCPVGSLLFESAITAIHFGRHSRRSPMSFFLIGEKDTQNIDEAVALTARYRERELVRVYVFSDSESGRVALENTDCGKVVLQRVNVAQKMVASLLYDRGNEIFDSAVPVGAEKEINALVVGLDARGREMLRALPWFCQMTGYRLTVHAFCRSAAEQKKMESLCPELFDEGYNGKFGTTQDACYRIGFHLLSCFESREFDEEISAIERVSFAFVSLGSDETNIRIAVKLRMLAERGAQSPVIFAVTENSEAIPALCKKEGELCNYKGQSYRIAFVGSTETEFSAANILSSELEQKALERHMKWGKEKDFWQSEYCYRSSVASAIHKKYKIYCGIPGADLPPEERNEDDRWALRRLEHQRWNAYMRSEGYVFAPKRNDLAKMHPCLIEFDKLPLEEQEKDDD